LAREKRSQWQAVPHEEGATPLFAVSSNSQGVGDMQSWMGAPQVTHNQPNLEIPREISYKCRFFTCGGEEIEEMAP